RAQQDIGDEAQALNEAKKPKGGFEAPDFGAPSAEDLAKSLRPDWMNEDGSINWDKLGLGPGAGAGTPRASELKSVKLFEDLKRAIEFLGDSSVPTAEKMRLLRESIEEWVKKQTGWNDFGDILWPGASQDLANLWATLKGDWERFSTGFSA